MKRINESAEAKTKSHLLQWLDLVLGAALGGLAIGLCQCHRLMWLASLPPVCLGPVTPWSFCVCGTSAGYSASALISASDCGAPNSMFFYSPVAAAPYVWNSLVRLDVGLAKNILHQIYIICKRSFKANESDSFALKLL
jgi:hypothetical protein